MRTNLPFGTAVKCWLEMDGAKVAVAEGAIPKSANGWPSATFEVAGPHRHRIRSCQRVWHFRRELQIAVYLLLKAGWLFGLLEYDGRK